MPEVCDALMTLAITFTIAPRLNSYYASEQYDRTVGSVMHFLKRVSVDWKCSVELTPSNSNVHYHALVNVSQKFIGRTKYFDGLVHKMKQILKDLPNLGFIKVVKCSSIKPDTDGLFFAGAKNPIDGWLNYIRKDLLITKDVLPSCKVFFTSKKDDTILELMKSI